MLQPHRPIHILSPDPETTRHIAQALARQIQPPMVIALYGHLGAGKTLFTQALAQALGVTVPVTSPTFTLINEYPLPNGHTLYHVDCYRLQDPINEAIHLGLEELFEQGIVVIEWADRIEPLLPRYRVDIILEPVDETTRAITLHTPFPWDPQAYTTATPTP